MLRTYSFLDFQASLVGPGGVIGLGNGSGAAEEGVTVETIEETDKMLIGADGSPMHSLNPSRAAKITVRLLKTSPVNGLLIQMMNLQRASSVLWATNVLSISDARGDVGVGRSVAFLKPPTLTYAKEAGMNEWEFNCGAWDGALAQV